MESGKFGLFAHDIVNSIVLIIQTWMESETKTFHCHRSKRSASRAVKHFIGILNRLINELTYIAIVVACVQLDRAMLTILHGHM